MIDQPADLNVSGIYQIVHLASGKKYVGSAVNVRKRWDIHRHYLRKRTHRNVYLQAAWDKHGEPAFEFSILELVSELADLIVREQHWIDSDNAFGEGYNLSPTAGSNLGTTRTPEVRARMSEAQKGQKRRPLTEEHRAKLSAVKKGKAKAPFSAEHREAIAAAKRGRKLSDETRAKMSAAKKGRALTPEHRAALAASFQANPRPTGGGMTGKTHSAETRAKMAATKARRKLERQAIRGMEDQSQ